MIIDMPSGRQTYDYDCGAKSLQLVLAYYGIDIREDALIKELVCDRYGTLAKNMAALAKRYGFRVTARSGVSLAALKKYLDDKRPVIVLVQAWAERDMTLEDWEKANDHGHYVIVIGYQGGKIVFEDPSSFPRTWMTEEEFLARWHYVDIRTRRKMNRFAIVLLGKEPVKMNRLEHMD
ncbi:MAG: cysteine peptidase family C39 domain-containing protein [Dehalococcoidales bacterium]|nr:cysteine peptidase family C39 domain-containing protein [Dehalococcoidales bacterium]